MEGSYDSNNKYIPHNMEIDDRESKISHRHMISLINKGKFKQSNGKNFEKYTNVIISTRGIEFYSKNTKEIDDFTENCDKQCYIETVGPLQYLKC
jgi:hypothetical protein